MLGLCQDLLLDFFVKPFALEINVIQQKLQAKAKYQQQNVSCVPVSPHCVFCQVRKTGQARAEDRNIKELES